MKSIFLIFILTTSFSPLIFTSDVSPSGAAAAVAVAAENLAAEKLFCMFCKKDRELRPCPGHSRTGYDCKCSYRMTCHACDSELVIESILSERKDKAGIAEAERIAEIAMAKAAAKIAQELRAQIEQEIAAKETPEQKAKKLAERRAQEAEQRAAEAEERWQKDAKIMAQEAIESRYQKVVEEEKRDKERRAQEAANKWLEANKRAAERIKEAKQKR
jgi:hypothetical protein